MTATHTPYMTQVIHQLHDDLRPAKSEADDKLMLQKMARTIVDLIERGAGEEVIRRYVKQIITPFATHLLLASYRREELRKLNDDALASDILSMTGKIFLNEQDVLDAAYSGINIGRWYQHGRKLYEVARGLAQRLMNTRVTGISSGVLRLPYPAVVVRVPESLGYSFTEILIRESPSYELPKESSHDGKIQQFIDALPEQARPTASRMFIERKVPRSWRIDATRLVQHGNDSMIFRASSGLKLWEDYDLDDILREMEYDTRDEPTQEAVRFALNVMLYLTWPDADDVQEERISKEWSDLTKSVSTLNGYKRERAQIKLRKLWSEQRLYIGAKVPFLLDESHDSTGAGSKLMVRTLVAGHWKMQPCGPRHTERKLIRIEPFWRGPLDGPESNPVRRVVDTKEKS